MRIRFTITETHEMDIQAASLEEARALILEMQQDGELLDWADYPTAIEVEILERLDAPAEVADA